MGASVAEIMDDDVVADVHADFMHRYDEGLTPAAIRKELEDEYAECLEDEDDMPLFWFAIAQSQWECTKLQLSVLAKVSHLIATGRGLERWRESGEEAVQERERILTAFVVHLQEVNPTPRKRGQKPSEI